jgi:WD40 repeat protein
MKKLHFLSIYLLLLACVLTSCSNGFSPAAIPTKTVAPSETPSPTSTPTLTPTPQEFDRTSCEKVQEIYHLGNGIINMLVYSKDGRWLAVATSVGVTLYEADSLTSVWSVNTEANLKRIAFSSDDMSLTGVDTFAHIYTWNVDDGEQLFSKTPTDINEIPTVFALSPDGATLAMPYYDDSIHLYQTSDATLAGKIEQFLYMGEFIYQITFSPDSTRLATTSFNGDVRIWSVPEKRMLYVLETSKDKAPRSIHFTPDGKQLAVNFEIKSGDKSVRMLNVSTGTWQHTLDGEVIAFVPDRFLVSFESERFIVRDFYSGRLLTSLSAPNFRQGALTLTPDGQFLAMSTSDGIHVRRWSNESYDLTTSGDYSIYTGLALSPAGDLFAAGTTGRVDIRSIKDGNLIHSLESENSSQTISFVAYSPTSDLVAGISGSMVYVWQVDNGSLLWSQDTGHSLNQLAFSPDGLILGAAYNEELQGELEGSSSIPLWNSTDGGELESLQGPKQILYPGYTSLVFSPDGNQLIAAQGGGDLDVWSFADNTHLYTLSISNEFMNWNPVLAFSPNQENFMSGSMDRKLHLWKVGSRIPVKSLDVKDSSVTALAYSGDGKMIAAGVDNDIRVWDVKKSLLLCSIKGSGDVVRQISFAPQGFLLVSLADDGIVRVWNMAQ